VIKKKPINERRYSKSDLSIIISKAKPESFKNGQVPMRRTIAYQFLTFDFLSGKFVH
jgi:hypothetical protein